MTPFTVHRIVQEIRNRRAELTADEKWARSLQDANDRKEVFQRVNFWRRLYAQADKEIALGDVGASIESGLESESVG